MTCGYDIVRKRNEEERERQSLERYLAPLEPIEPLEPLEPIAGSKTKNKINLPYPLAYCPPRSNTI